MATGEAGAAPRPGDAPADRAGGAVELDAAGCRLRLNRPVSNLSGWAACALAVFGKFPSSQWVLDWHCACALSCLGRPGPRVARLVESRAGCVGTPISLKLPSECWRFIQAMRSSPVPLPAGVHAILDRAPRVEFRGPMPEPRFVVTMTRPQVEALRRWLHALHNGLKHDDDRRLTCLQCISRVAVALMLSER
jgi:hypothetical protein